ncbi:MAG TPA: squalene synthase HpnC, partial [Casimicrobiaceae bacterium]|nr:squalene synthase HpnC [Casimicrobiaceae bacterium]
MPVAHYENFPVASWLAPAALRPAIVAIYHFARAADDIADEGSAEPTQRIAQLDHYEAMLDRIAKGDRPDEPPFASLTDAIRDHALPLAPFRDLLSAFRQDVLKTRYADFAELLAYCARSANPIGRLLLHLYRIDDSERLRQADTICSGLQLANFWQDVAIDWNKGRVYLPKDDMIRFNITEQQIAAGRCDERWRALIAFEVQRTRAMLESGRGLAQALPLRLKLELKMVVAGGLRILRSIDAVDGDVFRHRPVLSRGDWAAMSAAALFR